ncbi:hypothetical protein [Massilia yuzhufengensis]|uniref:Uncharacterized protein n=1 Tax=Massilia yuzhufengensis TaxID=1164594 RepID=A0A1I1UCN4_9BURK|nr:hypothetical protein [Massilia yuzhufengensis]SFD68601.1 hypothetical protein SAMN05216204_13320 [Massilia yuzhufengensis]
MTHQTPKAFDFGAEPEPPAAPAKPAAAPRAFDFGEEPAPPAATSTPTALSFDDLPALPVPVDPPKPAARVLFDSEDHPAVRDALALARADHPKLVEHAEQRMAALFRRLLPVRMKLVTEWAEGPLMEQAALLQPITELVLKFAQLAVPAQLEAALESTRATPSVFGKLFRRPMTPAQYKPALLSSREQLLQLIADSEVASSNLEASANNLALHGAALAVVAKLAGGAVDAVLEDALTQRRTLIQQAVRQAELSILQMGQVRQQAADLVGQVSSFLTVTLPALEMAQAQGGN